MREGLGVVLLFGTLLPAASPEAQRRAHAQRVVEELSLARTQPREYAAYLKRLRPWFREKSLYQPGKIPILTHEGLQALEECIAFLEQVDPVGPLVWSDPLAWAAEDHVREQGRSGEVGHVGGQGDRPVDRLSRYGQATGTVGELINYREEEPRILVIQLLVDDGVPNRGHRIGAFRPGFQVAGAATGPHPVYRSMTVVDLACRFERK